MEKRNKILKFLVSLLAVAAAIVLLGGLFGGARIYHVLNRGKLGPLTREDIVYQTLESHAPSSKDCTLTVYEGAAHENVSALVLQDKNLGIMSWILSQER